MRKKYRITSKFRFTLFATVLLLCLFTLIGTISGLNTVSSSSLDQYYQVQVQYGDTLWDIARRYNTTVEELVRINHISNPDLIHVGEILRIPRR